MPIDVSGSNGQTVISGSNTTISGSQGTTVISGSVLSGSEGAPATSIPIGPASITASLPYLHVTGALVLAKHEAHDCYRLMCNIPSGSSDMLFWVELTSSCA